MECSQPDEWLRRFQKGGAGHRHVAPVASQEAARDRYAYAVPEKTRSSVPAANLRVSTLRHVDICIERFLLFLFSLCFP